MPLTEQEMREIIVGDNAESRRAFLAVFGNRINPIVREATKAHLTLEHLASLSRPTDQAHTVFMFLHIALNSVISSINILIEGYPLAAGHLMRHYAEATAMALLCADSESGVLELFQKNPQHYSVNKAVHRLLRHDEANRLRRLVGFDSNKWEEFILIGDFYGLHSHVSAFSMSFHFPLDKEEAVIVGAYFDQAKKHAIGLELKRRRSAIEVLRTTIEALLCVLPRKP